MEFRKMVMMTLYIRDSKRETDIKNRLLDSVGEGKGGMIWGNSIGTCILSYVKQIASPSSMDLALKASALGQPWGMGWGGRWEGVWDRGHMYTHGWSCQCMAKPLQHCKVISLQLK